MDEKEKYLLGLCEDWIDYSGSYEAFVERYKAYRLYLLRHKDFSTIVKKAATLDRMLELYEDDGK